WKAPLLCAIGLTSWTILHQTLAYYLFDFDTPGRYNMFWRIVEVWIDGGIRAFVTFSYILRAMIVRTGHGTAIIFVVLLGASNLTYFFTNPPWAGPICQYSLLLGISALAAHVLPKKRERPLLNTLVEESE